MASTAPFSISTDGSVLDGFESDSVISEFSAMFGVTPDKAAEFVNTKKLIKKGLTQEQVDFYQSKLTQIGLAVAVDGVASNDEMFSLVEEPVKNAGDTSASLGNTSVEHVAAATPNKQPLSADQIECPKCKLVQAKGAECTGCGIIYERYKGNATNVNSDDAKRKLRARHNDEIHGDEITSASLLLPTVAAVIGAIVWIAIAKMFDMELGIIAWGIGGCIGMAAIMTGTNGHSLGLYCGVLAFLAIMVGKYFVYADIQQSYIEMFSEDGLMAELQDTFSELQDQIDDFALIRKDDTSIKKFMVKHDLTEAIRSSDVTPAELSDFKAYTQPYLEDSASQDVLSSSTDEFSDLMDEQVDSINNMSVFQFMFSELGLLDILFLFLGISTAYKIAREGS